MILFKRNNNNIYSILASVLSYYCCNYYGGSVSMPLLVNAFTRITTSRISRINNDSYQKIKLSMSSTENSKKNNIRNDVVVVSPPGGIGEVTAVEAAKLGSQVQWFVVSSAVNLASVSVNLNSATLKEIEQCGGSVQIAGAQDTDLLRLSSDDARNAVKLWCDSSTAKNGKSLICCLDGIDKDTIEIEEDLDDFGDKQALAKKKRDAIETWKHGVYVAAREASTSESIVNTGNNDSSRVIAIVSGNSERDDETTSDDNSNNKDGAVLSSLTSELKLPDLPSVELPKVDLPKVQLPGEEVVGGFLRNVIGLEEQEKRIENIPTTLTAAVRPNTKLRYGSLFGIPESSPNFSALVRGPRKSPEVCREYETRLIRLDATSSLLPAKASGAGSNYVETKDADFTTCRHAIGEAAARMATNALGLPSAKIDFCVSSLPGTDKFELWEAELERAQKQQAQTDSGLVFSQDFGNIPDPNRFCSWLCTKWGPTVLTKTYDLAAIRTGARPVYLRQPSETQVDIVWQELKDDDSFEAVNTGKLVIQIEPKPVQEDGNKDDATNKKKPRPLYSMKAMRVPPNGGKPLNGEAILVRRLADAASQAMEKGLATQPPRMKTMKKKKVEKPQVVSSRVMPTPEKNPAAAAVEAAKAAAMERPPPKASKTTTITTGPRQAGARRSSQRTRGSSRSGKPRQRKRPLPNSKKSDDNVSDGGVGGVGGGSSGSSGSNTSDGMDGNPRDTGGSFE